MTSEGSARVHPTAVLSGDVQLGRNVEIGAYAVLEGDIRLGDYCVVRPGAYLFGPLTMGRGNVVHTGAVLGDDPQHLKYKGERTTVEIGDANIFREHVTVHRGTTQSMKTTIGSHNFLMAGAHIAHDCVIGNRCLLTNGCLLGGHTTLEDNVIISGNSVVHQFVRIGRLALLSGISGSTKDIPPFVVQQYIDNTVGINVIGMRRAGMSNEQVNGVKAAFGILYRQGLVLPAAIEKAETEFGHVDSVQEMLRFLRQCSKGINPMRGRLKEEAA
jgi:UDP-N-acetylglucosamine acyltransferase